jgi:hypothetical protein
VISSFFQGRRAHALCAVLFVVITAVMGRDVLSQLSGHALHDEFDPMLSAGILFWNATRLPYTDGWWQLPIFHPARDAMAFSEHMLGISPLAAPIQWITGDPLVTYNLTALLTFPLCALAMYALIYRVTGSVPGALIAGLAYGFAPYRISQLPHVQMLASFWAPLALLGLHAYVETGRRRWLALFGVTWMLQGAANGYALVFFSVLVGLWVLWFVVRPRRWRMLAEIAGTGLIAVLPLLPILLKYQAVHAAYGFERGIGEVRFFSADVAALFCASADLEFWGWLRVACRAEGELFPGFTVPAIVILAIVGMLAPGSDGGRGSRLLTLSARVLLLFALVNAAIALVVAVNGPFRVSVGPIRLSSSSVAKPVLLAVVAFVLGLLSSRGARAAVRQSSALGFYLLTAVVMWVLTFGPTVTLMGQMRGYSGPYAWLMLLPGMSGLRVPARFWLCATLCLAAAAGIVVAQALSRRSRAVAALVVAVAGAGVVVDGWTRLEAKRVAFDVPAPEAAVGGTMFRVPIGDVRDAAVQFDGVVHGWRSVNGYSGYEPRYFWAIREGVRGEHAELLDFLQGLGELHVVLPHDSLRWQRVLERRPGVVHVGRSATAVQYRLPARAPAVEPEVSGGPLAVARITASCGGEHVVAMRDGDPATWWDCGAPQKGGEQFEADLGRPMTVAAVVTALGDNVANFPRHLVVETSLDGTGWTPAWDLHVVVPMILAGMRDPANPRVVVPFAPREARYVRLRQTGSHGQFFWSVSELELYSGVR